MIASRLSVVDPQHPAVGSREKESEVPTLEISRDAESLIAGYASYVSTADLTADAPGGAPAVTPATPWIIASSLPCGGAVSTIAGSAIGTLVAGC